MPHYLVLKRTEHDWTSYPGEILTDLNPDEATILMGRGFITPVPEDYPGTISRPPEPIAPLPNDSDDVRELMSNNRDRLNELAAEAGIAAPEKFGNKRALVEAILAKVEETDAAEAEAKAAEEAKGA